MTLKKVLQRRLVKGCKPKRVQSIYEATRIVDQKQSFRKEEQGLQKLKMRTSLEILDFQEHLISLFLTDFNFKGIILLNL